jgi:hypothetical protein
MKSHVLAIVCAVTVGGVARAQGGPAVASLASDSAAVAPGCAACPPCAHKICVVEPAKKKITKTIYDCRSEDFCLPKCTHGLLRFHRHKACDGCEVDCCTQCEKKIRTKNVLYKKIITTECDYLKCVVKEEPCHVPCPPPQWPSKCDEMLPPAGSELIPSMPSPRPAEK